MKPHKVACIIPYTIETARSTAFEQIARQTLAEAAGLALDAGLFSGAAACQR
jgi:hypothetical protein